MHQISKVLGFGSLAALLAVLGACDDESTNNTSSSTSTGTGGSTSSSSGTGGSTSGTGGSTSGCGGAPTCTPPSPAHLDVSATVGAVQGTIESTEGGPAANIPAEVCGTNLCKITTVNAQGVFNENYNQEDNLLDVRFLYGKGKHWVLMGTDLTSLPDMNYGTINAVPMPAFSAGVPFVDGDITQNGVTLSLEPCTNVKFPIDVTDPNEQVFRAVMFSPSDGTFPGITASLNFEVMVALAPMPTAICPAAKLTIPNDPSWAANAEVEFLLYGTRTFQHWTTYGIWEVLSEGTVSADGNTVSTNDGEGIPDLGLLGVRLK
jgi:hypothetical protein